MTVTLSSTGSGGGTTMYWRTVDGTATGQAGTQTTTSATSSGTCAGSSDYISPNSSAGAYQSLGSVNNTSTTITIKLCPDTTPEPTETFKVQVSTTTTFTSVFEGTVTLRNDDTSVVVGGAIAFETNSGQTNMTIPLTVTGAAAATGDLVVTYALTDGTGTGGASCTSGVDYVNSGTSATISANSASGSISVPMCGDATSEPDETFTVTISAVTNAILGATTSATGRLANDDGVAFAISASSGSEGTASNGTITFTVTKTGGCGGLTGTETCSVSYATSDGTAFAGTDYTGIAATTLSFAANDTSKTFAVTTTADSVYEADETFTATISTATLASGVGSGTFTTPSATGTITNDDAAPSITVAASTGGYLGALNAEVAAATAAPFTITLVQPESITFPATPFTILVDSELLTVSSVSSTTLTISARAQNGTAAALHLVGAPVRKITGVLNASITTSQTSFAVNEVATNAPPTVPFTIQIGSEQMRVTARVATATLNQYTYTVTRAAAPATAAANAVVRVISTPEGDSGTTPATFYVGRMGATAVGATVGFSLSGTADASDYTADPVSGTTLSWSSGGTEVKTVAISIAGDTTKEDDETIVLTLAASPTGATLPATTTSTVVIQNDDLGIAFALACTAAGCDSPQAEDTYKKQTGTLSARAASGSTTLSVTETAAPEAVPFFVKVDAEILKISARTGSGTAYTYTVDPVAHPAGTTAAHSSGAAVFVSGGNALTVGVKVTASGNTTGTITYATTDDASPPAGARAATAGLAATGCVRGVDYLAIPSTTTGTITPPADGATAGLAASLSIQLCADRIYEGTETFLVRISDATATLGTASPSGGSVSTFRLTISDHDTAPRIAISDVTAVEGDSGTTNFVFTVTRSGATEVATSIPYTVAGSGSNPASGSDFGTATPSSPISIGADNSHNAAATATITVPVVGDLTPELAETFDVTLGTVSPASSATYSDGVGTGTIQNDDTKVVIVNEGGLGQSESGGSYEFIVRVLNAHTNAAIGGASGVSLTYALSGVTSGAACTTSLDARTQGSAQSVDDYSSVYVTLCANTTAQADRTATVTFSVTNAIFSGVGANVKTFQIYDDDKTLAVKVVRDTNANGLDDTGDTAFGDVEVKLYVDGVNATGAGADGSFDPASDALVGTLRTSTASKTLGTGSFSNLRNLTYFAVETDPTALFPDLVSLGTIPGSGGYSTAVTGLSGALANNVIKVAFDPASNGVSGATLANKFLDTRRVGSISGTVAYDANANGTIERTELGVVQESTVRLYRDTGNGTFDPNVDSAVDPITGTAFPTATTDAYGGWSFEGLIGGTYFVVEVDPSAGILCEAGVCAETGVNLASTGVSPAQAAPLPWTGLADAYRFNVIKVVQASGTAVSTGSTFLDAVATSSIEGRLLNDVDASGNETGGDLALPSAATVNLYRDNPSAGTVGSYDAQDVLYATTTTTGSYAFGSVMKGTYYVIETDLAAYASTAAIAGSGTGTTSVIPTEAWAQSGIYLNNSIKVTVTADGATSDENLFLDAAATASIAGAVYDDVNANGAREAGETTRIAGATLALYRDNPRAGTVGSYDASDFLVSSTASSAAADTTFSNLVIGTYFLNETNAATFQSTGFVTDAAAGGIVGDSSNDRIEIQIATNCFASAGHAFLDAKATSTISGFVTEDVNGDATYQSAGPDRALRGAVVTLYRDNGDDAYGVGDTQIGAAQTTTLAGTYSFGTLLVGTYWVVETNPGDFPSTNAFERSTTAGTTTASKVDSDPLKVTIDVHTSTNAGGRFLDQSDFTISGTVFNDAAADLLSTGDAGKGGVTVTLYASDGTTVLGSTTSRGTNPIGSFGFGNIRTGSALADGTYVLAVSPPDTATEHWRSTEALLGTGAATKLSASIIEVVIDANAGNTSSTSHEFLISRDDYEIAGLILDDTAADRAVTGDSALASPSATITLYRDAPLTGTVGGFDAGDAVIEAKATAAGVFSFTGLTAGTYFLDETAVPTGYAATNAVPGTLVTSGGGTTATQAYVSDTRLRVSIVANGNIQARHTNNRFLVSDASRTISGLVIDDLDASGTLTEVTPGVNEGGLAGAEVSLYWDNPTAGTQNVFDVANDRLIGTAQTTTATGAFSWSGLVRGRYFLVKSSSAPTDYLSTASSAGTGTGTTAATETIERIRVDATDVGSTNADNRFFAGPATYTIQGVVYDDLDGSGAVNADSSGAWEPAKSGVQVTLTRVANGQTRLATTASAVVDPVLGTTAIVYRVTGLLAGAYTVTIAAADVPTGWVQTPQPDSAPTTWTRSLTLAGGQDILETPVTAIGEPSTAALFVRAKNATVSGTVYGDLDGTGTYAKNAGDTLIAGAVVTLFLDTNANGAYDAGDSAIGSATTGASGAFQIANLYANANYRLAWSYANHVAVLGTSNVLSISLGASGALSGKNFFIQPQSVISGTAWDDKNADGIKGASATELSGVTLELWRETDGSTGKTAGDTSLGTVTTAAGGAFTFSGLNSKTSGGIIYYLRQTAAPSGYTFTGVAKGTGSTVATTPLTTQEIRVTFTTAGTTSANNWFLDTRNDNVTISGTIFDDLNADGIVQTNTALPGATVAVYLDGGNDTYDAGAGDDTQIYAIANGGTRAASATSAADGTFSLGGLPTGTFFVVETDKTSPRYSSTASAPGVTGTDTTTTSLGVNVLKVVASAVDATSTGNRYLDTRDDNATISGAVFEDLNSDGLNQTSTPFAGALLQIYLDDGSTAGSLDATDTLLNAKVNGGARAASWTTTAGTNGTFSFSGLPTGTLYVVQTPPAPCVLGTDCYAQSALLVGSGAGTTASAPTSTVVTPNRQVLKVVITGTSGVSSANNQFLVTRDDGVVVTGAIYDDRNATGGSGVADAGDLGLATSVVKIYKDQSTAGTWDGAASEYQMKAAAGVTITNAAPSFSFSQLPDGLYWVTVTVPANYVRTGADLGAYGTLDPASTDALRVWKIDLRGTYSTTSTSRFFAARGGNSASGFSWYDLNGDGVANSKGNKADGKLPGTQVFLYKDDPNAADATKVGVWDAGDTLVTTNAAGAAITNPVTADSLGAWSFSNLLPGAYFALQVPPTTASGSSVDYRATGPLTQSALNTVVAACNTATSKLASVPTGIEFWFTQVSVGVAQVQLNALPLTRLYVTPVGIVTVVVLVVAGAVPPPTFETVTVYVVSVPATTDVTPSVIAIVR
ncbi:MAG: SdrD B-like domain-containing protein, partial [Actinomycetota bacterium]